MAHAASHDSSDSDAGLAAAWGLPEVWRFGAVGSTNDLARRLAGSGAAAGCAVLADEQRAGRGRGGRGWFSPPGMGIWLSVVLRPAELPNPALLPLWVGLAAARALDDYIPPPGVGIKWPNDLFHGGRKLGGILCEASWEGGTPVWVVAGIGVNLLQSEADFPAPIRASATSLRIASDRTLPLEEVAGALAGAVAEAGSGIPAALDATAAAELAARDVLAGQRVEVRGGGEALLSAGTALGIAPDGALLVRDRAGALRRVREGSVRLAPSLLAAESRA